MEETEKQYKQLGAEERATITGHGLGTGYLAARRGVPRRDGVRRQPPWRRTVRRDCSAGEIPLAPTTARRGGFSRELKDRYRS